MAERGDRLIADGAVLAGAEVRVMDGVVDSDREIRLSLWLNGQEIRNFYVSAHLTETALFPPITVPLDTLTDVEAFLEA